jgi:TolB-like protein
MHFNTTRAALPEITQQLGVDAVLEGSVLVGLQEIRLRVRLVDGSSDRSLWAETYERRLEEASAIREQIAEAVAQHIQR